MKFDELHNDCPLLTNQYYYLHSKDFILNFTTLTTKPLRHKLTLNREMKSPGQNKAPRKNGGSCLEGV